MFIEVEDLKQELVRVRHVYQPAQLRINHEDANLSEPVAADFVLTHKDKELHIDGSFETAIRYKCARCLRECAEPLKSEFELLYLPQPKPAKADEEIELKYDEMDVAYYDGIRLDVDLMVIEQIELSLPMKFVCREECKGLCPNCGRDLNEEPCGCSAATSDSRLAALLEFRKKMDE